MSIIIEKEGKTVEQAIEKGLAQMGLQREDCQVEIISLGSSGFLGIFGTKPAKVRLKVLPQPKIKRLVETIFEKMGMPGTVTGFIEEDNTITATIECDGDDQYLKANRGMAIEAIEYLVGKIYRDSDKDIRLDIGGFRQDQSDDLHKRALELAAKVAETGEEHKMEPMPPHQRKIVHKALERHPDVKTFAVGNGDRRRVIIALRLAGEKPAGAPGTPATPLDKTKITERPPRPRMEPKRIAPAKPRNDRVPRPAKPALPATRSGSPVLLRTALPVRTTAPVRASTPAEPAKIKEEPKPREEPRAGADFKPRARRVKSSRP